MDCEQGSYQEVDNHTIAECTSCSGNFQTLPKNFQILVTNDAIAYLVKVKKERIPLPAKLCRNCLTYPFRIY